MMFLKMILLIMYVYISAYESRGEKDVRSPGARVIGSRELSDVGAGNRTWVLCKNSMCS